MTIDHISKFKFDSQFCVLPFGAGKGPIKISFFLFDLIIEIYRLVKKNIYKILECFQGCKRYYENFFSGYIK